MPYQCPECASTILTVQIEVEADLFQSDNNFETMIEGGDHYWTNESSMTCKECGHSDNAGKFDCTKS